VVSVVFHVTQSGVQWVLARALGIDLPFGYCLILHPVLSVMMALPVSVGGFGVREGGYLYFLTRINVDDSLAVTMGLLWFAVTVMAGLVGGAFFVAAGAELPRLRRRADGAAAVGS
jgi:glycosyltransferase 2 family protein